MDAMERDKEFVIQIRNEQQIFFDDPKTRPYQIFGREKQKAIPLIDRCMNYMHGHNKKLLSELLRPEIVEEISLWMPENDK